MKRHIKKIRLTCLGGILLILLLLPILQVYQNHAAAHSYHRLSTGQQLFYDITDSVVSRITDDPANDLDNIKGTTWSASIFGVKLSDPLALISQIAASHELVWPFALTALIPIIATLLFGRFFCSWICPANLLFELNDNMAAWLHAKGLRFFNKPIAILNSRTKFFVLGIGIIFCTLTGLSLFASIYPPAIIGREIYYAVSLSGFSIGIFFLSAAILFDLLIKRRGFCRFLCPGGAVYTLLGHFRLLRIKRKVQLCNDCKMCNAICPYELNPMQDKTGQECNNCGDCIAVCHSEALHYHFSLQDPTYQGKGLYDSRQPTIAQRVIPNENT